MLHIDFLGSMRYLGIANQIVATHVTRFMPNYITWQACTDYITGHKAQEGGGGVCPGGLVPAEYQGHNLHRVCMVNKQARVLQMTCWKCQANWLTFSNHLAFRWSEKRSDCYKHHQYIDSWKRYYSGRPLNVHWDLHRTQSVWPWMYGPEIEIGFVDRDSHYK